MACFYLVIQTALFNVLVTVTRADARMIEGLQVAIGSILGNLLSFGCPRSKIPLLVHLLKVNTKHLLMPLMNYNGYVPYSMNLVFFNVLRLCCGVIILVPFTYQLIQSSIQERSILNWIFTSFANKLKLAFLTLNF